LEGSDKINVIGVIKCNDDTNTPRKLLQQRKRESLLVDINTDLLEKVYEVLSIGEHVFDMLEQAKVPTLQSVVPSFYLLRNTWEQHTAGEDRRIKILKKELVSQLDAKVWTSITAVHMAATYLDPTFKQFICVPLEVDR
jgi:F0F1-type ATP synthase alpha subunit